MQGSSLRGNNGPRYRHVADASAAYETISIDKLTPIVGAEIGGSTGRVAADTAPQRAYLIESAKPLHA